MPRLPDGREIGQDFADHAREFEPMPAEPAGDRSARMIGMAIDDEMMIGAVGVEARAHGEQRAIGFGEKLSQDGAEGFFIARSWFAIDVIRIGDGAGAVMGDFEARVIAHHGKTIVQAPIAMIDRPDGEPAQLEERRIEGPDPSPDLARDAEELVVTN